MTALGYIELLRSAPWMRAAPGRAESIPRPILKLLNVMSSIMRWNPFADLENMHRELASLLEGSKNGRATTGEWAPVVDIIEEEQAYVINVELPSMKREDVHVRLEGGVLNISGERKAEKEEKSRKYHRIERAYGRFSRSFELPENIDSNKVSASYKEGVLTVSVAKSEKALPKQIEVSVN